MFSGKHKNNSLSNQQTKQLRLLFMFAYFGIFQLPTLNLGIPSQCPHYKLRVRNKISEKNKIFKRTCRGYWLVDQHAHQTHNLPQFVCQSVGKNFIFRESILSPLGLSNEITKKRYTISVLILKNSSDTAQGPILGSCNI